MRNVVKIYLEVDADNSQINEFRSKLLTSCEDILMASDQSGGMLIIESPDEIEEESLLKLLKDSAKGTSVEISEIQVLF